jgi:chromosome segregation ATPase
VGPQSKSEAKDDSVKLKSKPSKSVAELEMLIESLKRVIEKQKTEADAMRARVEQMEARGEKLKSEKQLRQRIEALEAELHSYEMKDVNVGEKDRTIKKLIEANKTLKEELDREVERFMILEDKYKDLLMKYNQLAKDHARNAELLFTTTTGAKMGNFNRYLSSTADV